MAGAALPGMACSTVLANLCPGQAVSARSPVGHHAAKEPKKAWRVRRLQQTPKSPLGGTNAIIAEVLKRGGRISRSDLIILVRQHGYDPRTVGVLHGRRLAHLRRDQRTQESILTARGEEVARQYLFAARLAQRASDVTSPDTSTTTTDSGHE